MVNLHQFPYLIGKYEQRGVIVDIPENLSLIDIESYLHNNFRSKILTVDLILLRFPPWIMRSPTPSNEEKEGIDRITHRFPNTSVHILCTNDYQYKIGANLSNTYRPPNSITKKRKDFLENLRNHELMKIMEASNSLYSVGDNANHVFRLPSKAFSPYFFRVGNVQTSSHSLDTIFFWMIPFLRNIGGILLDTWSIGSIGLNCVRRIDSYDPNKAKSLQLEIMDSYLDDRKEAHARVIELARKASLGYQAPLLIVFSTVMTGRSIKKVSAEVSNHFRSLSFLKVLVLYKVGDTSFNTNGIDASVLCPIRKEGLGQHSDNYDEKQISIPIDRTTYFPVFINEDAIRLTNRVASKNKSFVDAYGDKNVIRIHADSFVDGQKSRHHGVYIDVCELMKIQNFLKKLDAVLNELPSNPPHLIITPPHDAGKALADHVKKFYGGESTDIKVVIHLDLSTSSWVQVDEDESFNMNDIHRQLKSLDENAVILVVDDVITTGNRLLNYQKRLRDLDYRGRIHYVVGVQRMESEKAFADLSSTLKANNLGDSHCVKYVEQYILPNWGEDTCPFCIEEKFLKMLLISDTLKDIKWIGDRLEKLSKGRISGLSNDVFMVHPNSRSPALTLNSYFGKETSSQAAVFSAVAAAIQELRTSGNNGKALNGKGFPVRTLIHQKDFCGRYTDGILRASLFRSLYPEEILSSSDDKNRELTNLVQEILSSDEDDDKNVYAEIALAIGLGKLPTKAVTDALRVRFEEIGSSELFSFMETPD